MKSVSRNRISKRSLFLFLSDIICVAIAYWIGVYLRNGFWPLRIFNYPPYIYSAFVVFPFMNYVFDLYYPFKYFKNSQTAIDVLLSITLGSVFLAAAVYADRSLLIPRSTYLYMAIALCLLFMCVRLIYDSLFRSRFLDKKTLVIGAGPFACEMAAAIKQVPYSGMELVGIISDQNKSTRESVRGTKIIGHLDNLLTLIDWHKIELIVLALESKRGISELRVVSDLIKKQVMVASGVYLYENLREEVPYQVIESQYLIGLMAEGKKKAYLRIKRIMDIFVGSIMLLLLGPILLISILILLATQRKNPIFMQKRIGEKGKPFQLIKLRTMTEKKNNKQSVTALGKWLRKFRIDEIPQLINVIRGDMSLIGPRPEIPYFVERSRKKIPFYDLSFTVKPGLTGWAQVKFRHATSIKDYAQKFRYNLYYLKNLSFQLDLIIFLRTIRVVLLGKGK